MTETLPALQQHVADGSVTTERQTSASFVTTRSRQQHHNTMTDRNPGSFAVVDKRHNSMTDTLPALQKKVADRSVTIQ